MANESDENYPAQYESTLKLKNGEEVFLRPVRHTDGNLILDLFNKLDSDSIYMRFLSPLKSLPDNLLHELTHINYTNNFALAAVIKEYGRDSIIAVARYGYDSEEKVTDFAITVRDDWQNLGLGKLLTAKLLNIGKEHGIPSFVSIIDSTNHTMKHVLKKLGYTVKYSYKTGATKVEIFV